jgi:phosphohistidine phosphatase
MQRLILLRHGKADSASGGGGDFARGLTARGVRESTLIGRVLADAGLEPDLALVSTAARAMQTWEAARAAFPNARMAPARELYHASPEVLADAVARLDGAPASVMIVGHNPGLHEYALALGGAKGARELAVGFPTAAAAVFDALPVGGFQLARFLTPREYEGLGASGRRSD